MPKRKTTNIDSDAYAALHSESLALKEELNHIRLDLKARCHVPKAKEKRESVEEQARLKERRIADANEAREQADAVLAHYEARALDGRKRFQLCCGI